MATRTPRPKLTAEQRAEADRIRHALLAAADADIQELADLLASKDDSNTFGATEFTVRDIVLRVGAKAIEAALAEREKKVTTGAAASAPPAGGRPSSNAGSSSPS